ncbi:MAG: hypothetical protein DRJ01_19215 [Bacteroidetes bacterium]|nr:MAG: hypothetical protein DRJ01_19215 [Bacteroidota bacterium]
MKKIILLASIALIFSCNNQKKEKKEITETKTETKVENSVYGTQNYAVVWKWTTTDKQLITDNAPTISQELNNLWKNGVVENAYYDANSKVDKFEHFPNITFFLRAKSLEKAKSILNNLTIVKKGIAEHTIYPVGTLWLGRNADKVNNYGNAQTYVAVWNTVTEYDNSKAKELIEKTAQEQNDAMLKLWKEGTVENAYFDIEGTVKHNQKTDFVFFINAKTEKEARVICDNLPFSKKHLASYQLLPVGTHWLGKHKN